MITITKEILLWIFSKWYLESDGITGPMALTIDYIKRVSMYLLSNVVATTVRLPSCGLCGGPEISGDVVRRVSAPPPR